MDQFLFLTPIIPTLDKKLGVERAWALAQRPGPNFRLVLKSTQARDQIK